MFTVSLRKQFGEIPWLKQFVAVPPGHVPCIKAMISESLLPKPKQNAKSLQASLDRQIYWWSAVEGSWETEINLL